MPESGKIFLFYLIFCSKDIHIFATLKYLKNDSLKSLKKKMRWLFPNTKYVWLLMMFLFSGVHHAFAQGKIYAVIIGVSEYQDSRYNLTYCHRDANEMYHLLREHTIADRMKLLTNREAQHDNIVYHARQLFRQAKPEDIVIFFFSGHGSSNLFVTHDKNLSFATLQKIFKECKANRKMIFADACYAGTLRQQGRQPATSNQNAGKNVMLFLSSRSNQLSRETYMLQNGLFTHFLILGLKGEADANRDNYITAIELFTYVNPRVKEMSQGKQVPVMWGKFDKNMVVIRKGK